MNIVQLMASPFVGGPERQMLGLSKSLPGDMRTVFVTFAERGLAGALLDEVHRCGFEGVALESNFPHVFQAAQEIADHLQRVEANVVCCNGYKPDVIGWMAAQQVGIPVVSVSHGWTAATWKVRCYETLDRLLLRQMDAVVCVAAAQAKKVRNAGVASNRIHVIRNAVGEEAFAAPDPDYRGKLNGYFATKKRWIIGAAGRLSPEKGFDQLIAAAKAVISEGADAGVVIFGDGPLRSQLKCQISDLGLQNDVVLAGFHSDVQRFMPHWDLAVLSSHTEGLPVFVLEAMAAGLPVVATAVGGTPEVVDDGETGFLVSAGDVNGLARNITKLLKNENQRKQMGRRGRERVRREFSFTAQSVKYERLFRRLIAVGAHESRNEITATKLVTLQT